MNRVSHALPESMRVRITRRARRSMEQELARYPDVETGGILLGYSAEDCVSILEATDGGIGAVSRTPDSFSYDAAYQSHLCAVLSQVYTPELSVVGVWHKHNSTCPRESCPFSPSDDKMNLQLLELYGHGCVSLLFEKKDVSTGGAPCYDMRVFLLEEDRSSKGLRYTELHDIGPCQSPIG